MTPEAKSYALERLRELVLPPIKGVRHRDCEADHVEADDILLDLIGDDEIRNAFEAIEKWYA